LSQNTLGGYNNQSLARNTLKNTTASVELPRDWENLIVCVQHKPPITVTHGAERVPEFQNLGQDIRHSQNDK